MATTKKPKLTAKDRLIRRHRTRYENLSRKLQDLEQSYRGQRDELIAKLNDECEVVVALGGKIEAPEKPKK